MENRAFFHLYEDADGNARLERIDGREFRWPLKEEQDFLKEAKFGEILQIQEREYLLCLGPLTVASWMRR